MPKIVWEKIRNWGVAGLTMFLGFALLLLVSYLALLVDTGSVLHLRLQRALQWNDGALLFLGGGSLILLGLGALMARIRVSQELARVQVREERGRRYIAAINQLGNLKENNTPNVEVRLGALYCLAALMKEATSEYHHQVLSLLCAYLSANAELYSDEKGRLKVRSDVHSCVQMIARRKRHWDEEKIDFENLNFTGFLLEGADFEHAIMRDMNLEHANLGESNFKYATIQRSNFHKAVIWRSSFEHAYISESVFHSTAMRQAVFDSALIYKSYFRDVYLGEVSFKRASLQDSSFESCSHLNKSQLFSTREIKDIILPNGDKIKSKAQLRNYQEDLSRKEGYLPQGIVEPIAA